MKKSKIKLYALSNSQRIGFNKSKNFMFDNIENVLIETGPALEFNNFQYIKHELQLEIVIKIGEGYILKSSEFKRRYARIQNYYIENNVEVGDMPMYYFVDSITWASEHSIKLNLTLDVLNSFHPSFNTLNSVTKDYEISKRSNVMRRHKNRFTYCKEIYSQTSLNVYQESYDGTKSHYKWQITDATSEPELVNFIGDFSAEFIEFVKEGNIWYAVIEALGDHYSISATIYYYSLRLANKIDYISEGNAPIKYKKREEIIHDPKDDTHSRWYLIYRNKNEITSDIVNPVDCFIISDQPIKISYLGVGGILPSDITSTTYMYMFRSNAQNSKYRVSMMATIGGELREKYSLKIQPIQYIGRETVMVLGTPIAMDTYEEKMLIFQKVLVGGDYYFRCRGMHYKYSLLGSTKYNEVFEITKEYWEIEKFEIDGITNNTFKLYYSADGTYDSLEDFSSSTNVTYTFTPSMSGQLKTIDDVDRTDEKIIKILALPYMPFEQNVRYDASEGYYINIPSNCEYDSSFNALKVTSLSTQLFNQFQVGNAGQSYGFKDGNPLYTNGAPVLIGGNTDRYIKDPKLLHSDYYYQKAVYDTFNYVFKFEEYEPKESDYFSSADKSYYNFNVSKNASGRFMMRFPSWKPNKSQVDFDSLMIVNRNNEVTLFNNAYLTYLRTAYNYDVKAKNREQISSILGLGSGMLRTATSPSESVAGVLGGATGIFTGAITTLMNVNQAEDSLASKMKQLEYQASSILNADDLDLLEAYSENKFKLEEYEVTDDIKKLLDDTFYYYGYIEFKNFNDNMMNTRKWFNYIKADIEIDNKSSELKEEWIDEIISKFKEGVTYFHGVNISGFMTYDISQTKENWETNIDEE